MYSLLIQNKHPPQCVLENYSKKLAKNPNGSSRLTVSKVISTVFFLDVFLITCDFFFFFFFLFDFFFNVFWSSVPGSVSVLSSVFAAPSTVEYRWRMAFISSGCHLYVPMALLILFCASARSFWAQLMHTNRSAPLLTVAQFVCLDPQSQDKCLYMR